MMNEHCSIPRDYVHCLLFSIKASTRCGYELLCLMYQSWLECNWRQGSNYVIIDLSSATRHGNFFSHWFVKVHFINVVQICRFFNLEHFQYPIVVARRSIMVLYGRQLSTKARCWDFIQTCVWFRQATFAVSMFFHRIINVQVEQTSCKIHDFWKENNIWNALGESTYNIFVWITLGNS